MRITLQRQWITWGDLDGDGSKDAALILKCERSYSLDPDYYLVAVVNNQGRFDARPAVRLGGGSGFRIDSVAIVPGRILVDLWQEAYVSPISHPIRRFRETYWLEHDQLRLRATTPVSP